LIDKDLMLKKALFRGPFFINFLSHVLDFYPLLRTAGLRGDNATLPLRQYLPHFDRFKRQYNENRP